MTDETERHLDKQILLRKTKAELVEIVLKLTDAYLHYEEMVNFFRSRSLDNDEKSKSQAEILAQLALPLEIAKARTVQTTAAAKRSVERRPASKVKSEVEFFYREWVRTGKFSRLSKAEFARKMVNKFNANLTTNRTVENWCRNWDKEK